MKYVAFINGMVFNSDTECFERADVLACDGLILELDEHLSLDSISKDEIEIVDLKGKYIIPGLVDVHSHGIGGHDFDNSTSDNVEHMRYTYAKVGTTSVMATIASQPLEQMLDSIRVINQKRGELGCFANVIGIHLEGRYLNPLARGAHAEHLLALPSVKELDEFVRVMLPLPCHFSISPELDGATDFIKRAVSLGCTVGVAHTKATYEQALEAVSNGASSFTHTYNAMTPVHHRMPGVIVCSLLADNAYSEFICDGEHSHPAMIRLAYKTKAKDKLVLITDSMSATAVGDGTYGVAGTAVYVKDGRATNAEGALAGSTLTLFKAVTNMMKFCGITLNEALKFATVNPAKMVNAEGIGKLDKNYRADLIVISDPLAPEIDAVYVGANKID
ncbi:MAG: N-acetylglucosamine-6-phosphate deacetylase [Clostridia bacterium]|nr:N-acetylglucosamine-6-phosphate deacetylase [Clostridia bacterium]